MEIEIKKWFVEVVAVKKGIALILVFVVVSALVAPVYTDAALTDYDAGDIAAINNIISLRKISDIPDDGEFFSQKDNCNVLLTWMPTNELKKLTIYPSFIKDKICSISDSIEHFITIE